MPKKQSKRWEVKVGIVMKQVESRRVQPDGLKVLRKKRKELVQMTVPILTVTFLALMSWQPFATQRALNKSCDAVHAFKSVRLVGSSMFVFAETIGGTT
jgi:heme/copper-type cytochrome/quinol oxidase subunit 2